MTTGKLVVAGLAVSLALGGGVAALTDDPAETQFQAISLDDRDEGVIRRDDIGDEIAAVDDDDDDPTGDGDATGGNDGTNGGNNSYSGGDDASDSADGGSGGTN